MISTKFEKLNQRNVCLMLKVIEVWRKGSLNFQCLFKETHHLSRLWVPSDIDFRGKLWIVGGVSSSGMSSPCVLENILYFGTDLFCVIICPEVLMIKVLLIKWYIPRCRLNSGLASFQRCGKSSFELLLEK